MHYPQHLESKFVDKSSLFFCKCSQSHTNVLLVDLSKYSFACPEIEMICKLSPMQVITVDIIAMPATS